MKKGMDNIMIYIFSITIIYTLIKQWKELLSKKRNLFIYLLLTVIGMALGIVYLINPYLPSLSVFLEKHMK